MVIKSPKYFKIISPRALSAGGLRQRSLLNTQESSEIGSV